MMTIGWPIAIDGACDGIHGWIGGLINVDCATLAWQEEHRTSEIDLSEAMCDDELNE